MIIYTSMQKKKKKKFQNLIKNEKKKVFFSLIFSVNFIHISSEDLVEIHIPVHYVKQFFHVQSFCKLQ